MKRILWSLLLVVSALAMAGCEDIPGVLIVTKDFSVLVKGKNKTVSAGEHKTSLDFKKNKVVATIKTGNDSLKVELAVPQGSQIPSNGDFELKSAQTGQPFDIFGHLQTTVTEVEQPPGYESCQKQDFDTICDNNGCHVAPVTRPGNRYIEFFYRYTDQMMQFDMVASSNAQDKYGDFQGHARSTEKIVTYEGACL